MINVIFQPRSLFASVLSEAFLIEWMF